MHDGGMTTKETTIGKTTYQIIEQGTEEGTFFYILKKGKTEKTLINMDGEWFLSTGSRGLPKPVTPKFSNVLAVA